MTGLSAHTLQQVPRPATHASTRVHAKQTAPADAAGWGLLLASGCGTAVAAVCASGLLALSQQAPGLWAALAVCCGGLLAAVVARSVSRLARHTPSQAGLIAYLGRAFGRQAALLLALPYFLLSLFLVGAEATLVGVLVAQLVPGPPLLFALGFLLATWRLARRGLRLSLRTQAACTWALVACLSLCALHSLVQTAAAGNLSARLLTSPPSLMGFLGAVAQSLFLFMGFELITSQTSPVSAPALRRALLGSASLLTAFYALLALALTTCNLGQPGTLSGLPQLALAQRTWGLPAVATITLLSLLASYTSFNGALLALSRLSAALAGLGSLPASWAHIDRHSLLPLRALSGLLVFCVAATLLVSGLELLWAAIWSAAPAAAVVYAALVWASPSVSPDQNQDPLRSLRARVQRLAARGVAMVLAGLALAVLCDLGQRFQKGAAAVDGQPTAAQVLPILAGAYALAAILVFSRPFRRPRTFV